MYGYAVVLRVINMCDTDSIISYFDREQRVIIYLYIQYITFISHSTFFVNNTCVKKALTFIYVCVTKYMKSGGAMAVSNEQTNFRRGVMSLVILSLLKSEDMYGYQLVQETEKRSGGRIVTQEGSLYPVLYKLLDQEYISSHEVQVGKRMKRIYYHLEHAGEVRLSELLAEYEAITTGVFMIAKGVDNNDR